MIYSKISGFLTFAIEADLIISTHSSSDIPFIGLNSIKGKISNETADLIKEFSHVVHLSPFGFIKGLVFKHLKHNGILLSLSIYGFDLTDIISLSIFDCLM